MSGCWESNPVINLPKVAYYRYTTARIYQTTRFTKYIPLTHHIVLYSERLALTHNGLLVCYFSDAPGCIGRVFCLLSPVLTPLSTDTQKALLGAFCDLGAARENRTPAFCLASKCSTTKPWPLVSYVLIIFPFHQFLWENLEPFCHFYLEICARNHHSTHSL